LKNPTNRLARWALKLLEYNYEVSHWKGCLASCPWCTFTYVWGRW